jgi:hypothetical protein
MNKETIEEAARRIFGDDEDGNYLEKRVFIKGAKWQQEKMYSEEEMINFAEFVATYTDKNRNVNGEMLHAKSKYDGAERTIDLLEKWFEQFKKK